MTVTVTVTDENEAPAFEQADYAFSLEEGVNGLRPAIFLAG